MSFLISEAAAPATPATGKVAVYAKSDGLVYSKDDVGTEKGPFGGTTLGTYTTLSGTAVDFVNIPDWVTEISMQVVGGSSNGSSNPLFQLGDSGGIENTGYLGSGGLIATAATTTSTYTTGFGFGSGASANIFYGSIVFRLADRATNTWVAAGNFGLSSAGACYIIGGSKSLSSTLTQVRITFVNGTDTFDAGSVNILYR